MKAMIWHVAEDSGQQSLKFYLHDIWLNLLQVFLVPQVYEL